ncbi:PGPGW domain-containing protein [Citrifermentans bremense]|nr:PGPGW domain-containing protein [Citrifermentans bremense]
MPAKSLNMLKRFFVAFIGQTLVAVGSAMIVMPGPAIVMDPRRIWGTGELISLGTVPVEAISRRDLTP